MIRNAADVSQLPLHLVSNHGRRKRKYKRSQKKQHRATAHTGGETPGKIPCDLPLKPKNDFFIMLFCDLPCKRTCHGKGRMTKMNQDSLAKFKLWPFRPDIILYIHLHQQVTWNDLPQLIFTGSSPQSRSHRSRAFAGGPESRPVKSPSEPTNVQNWLQLNAMPASKKTNKIKSLQRSIP